MAEFAEIRMPEEQEGTKSVVRAWLKEIGQPVKRDDPLVEIETDKVAVEVPAPADGVLTEIAIAVGDEAAPGAKLGLLQVGGKANVTAQSSAPAQVAPRAAVSENGQRLSPLVRRLLAEHRLNAADITSSGADGRISARDVEAHIARRKPGASAPAPRATTAGGVTRIPHDGMRKSIADHMAHALSSAPHVTAVFEADFSAIMAHRALHRAAYDKASAPLTYSAYIVAACCEAMKVSPNVNSRWRDDALEVFGDVNIGMGVALGDKGLIVPVTKQAQTLSLLDTAKRLGELTDKARSGKLAPSDVQGGTFTISNHGVSGSLVATPIIINQGQAAILGVGKLEKRVVVRDVGGSDAIVVRPMAYVSLTIDHRVLDGHQTNTWLSRFVDVLENWPLEDTI